MHLLVREQRLLDEEAPAVEPEGSPADLLLLSLSDADLALAADAWAALPQPRPTLRLERLSRLRHPLSVDLFVERIAAGCRCVVLRLIGGIASWPYGAPELSAACARAGVPLVVLPADARPDPSLRALGTLPAAAQDRLHEGFTRGGVPGLAHVLRLAAHAAGLAADPGPLLAPEPPAFAPHPLPPGREAADWPRAAIVLYRSHALSGDDRAVAALAAALRARGLAPRAWHVGSLKDPACAAGITEALRRLRPAVVLNATGFSARGADGASPLDAAGAPVLQLVLSASSREAWAASARGLSEADLAMQVVLPELDGRLLTAAIGFKAEVSGRRLRKGKKNLLFLRKKKQKNFCRFGTACDARSVPNGQKFFASFFQKRSACLPLLPAGAPRVLHRPDPHGVALAADRAAGWARLAGTPRAGRRLALLLSDYPCPGGAVSGQLGHAVGLDALGSVAALLPVLRARGWDAGEDPLPDAAALARALSAAPAPTLPLPRYRALLAALPEGARGRLHAAWGDPADDPSVRDGVFHHRHLRLGRLLLAPEPDRGDPARRREDFHDPDLPPRHALVAFHLWLREAGTHALLHMGAHGTLEWLPGKPLAPGPDCFPSLLAGGTPVIYPFISSNPGEAAGAKRRLGAVTIGHLPPPLGDAGLHGEAAALERLLDEYAAADGLDRRRTALLRREVLERAAACGLLREIGAPPDASDEDALARLDAFLCDVKVLRVSDGLHVLGVAPAPPRRAALLQALGAAEGSPVAAALDGSAPAELDAVLDALDGRFVPAGPSGCPASGRADVLPTGRNLHTVDPRAVPTPAAETLAVRAAEDLLARHLQSHGDWPRRLVLDLWGGSTMRTGGEDLALALHLLGTRPVRDPASARVTGVEAVPLAELDRPRVDVTLRISGLFRDAFPAQVALFDAAVRMIAARDEASDWNPLAAAARGLSGAALRRATTRIFGAPPGAYGAGLAALLATGSWRDRDELAHAWLAASAAAYGQDLDGAAAPDALRERVAAADAFVHRQDHAGTDVLDGPDVAAHEGGFAAAAALLGASPALWHVDATRPEAPVSRTTAEEVRRVTRGRAANPRWLAGMMRHGHRGGAEMARALDALHGFAATLPERLDPQYDLLLDATLADPAVDAFLRAANPEARAAMAARFAEALERGLWRPRRNDLAAVLEG